MSVPNVPLSYAGPSIDMDFVGQITGLSANMYETANTYGSDATVIRARPESMIFIDKYCVNISRTHTPRALCEDPQLLGTADGSMFWAPPLAGEQRRFAIMLADLLAEDPGDQGQDGSQILPDGLLYANAKAAKDARRGTDSSLEPVPNPSFPTTDEQDQIYVARLVNACTDMSQVNANDKPKTLATFKNKVRNEAYRIEQGCWDLLEAVKLDHIRNTTFYHSKSEFAFAGDFNGHITTLCDDLLRKSKTACNTVTTRCNGLASLVDDPAARKASTEANSNVNGNRGYIARGRTQPSMPPAVPGVPVVTPSVFSSTMAPPVAAVPAAAPVIVSSTMAPPVAGVLAGAPVAVSAAIAPPVFGMRGNVAAMALPLAGVHNAAPAPESVHSATFLAPVEAQTETLVDVSAPAEQHSVGDTPVGNVAGGGGKRKRVDVILNPADNNFDAIHHKKQRMLQSLRGSALAKEIIAHPYAHPPPMGMTTPSTSSRRSADGHEETGCLSVDGVDHVHDGKNSSSASQADPSNVKGRPPTAEAEDVGLRDSGYCNNIPPRMSGFTEEAWAAIWTRDPPADPHNNVNLNEFDLDEL